MSGRFNAVGIASEERNIQVLLQDLLFREVAFNLDGGDKLADFSRNLVEERLLAALELYKFLASCCVSVLAPAARNVRRLMTIWRKKRGRFTPQWL